MTTREKHPPPADAAARRAANPVVCYPPETLPPFQPELYQKAREGATRVNEISFA
jgi:hypothetical protein